MNTPQPSVKFIADRVSEGEAQVAVAKVLAALGSDEDWHAETLDGVVDAVRGIANRLHTAEGVPLPWDQDDDALEFWQTVGGC